MHLVADKSFDFFGTEIKPQLVNISSENLLV